MRVKHDLRHEFSIVLLQARVLLSAMLAMPESVEAMDAAMTRLGATERDQMARDLRELGQRCAQISERSRWLAAQLRTGIVPGGV